ncbi:MAG: hypothetical protein V3U03_06610 [Myxococcota bacterium]
MSGSGRWMRRAAALALVLAVAGGWPAAAEVRKVEAVGAVALDTEHSVRNPRDAALQAALLEAVRRVALEMVPDLGLDEEQEELDAALGDQSQEFVSGYRIIDDRGERPALFVDDPEAETEYAMIVEVQVNTDRVRDRLVEAGLLEPSGDGRRVRLRLEIRDVESYAVYRAIRTLLDEVGVRSALPVEMERGRVVLDVDGDREGTELLEDLLRAAPDNLTILPIDSDYDRLTLRARFQGTRAAPARSQPRD